VRSLKPVAVLGLLCFFSMMLLAGCGPSKKEIEQKKKAAAEAARNARIEAYTKKFKAPVIDENTPFTRREGNLKFLDEKVGGGSVAAEGSTVSVEFVGWVDGVKIDSSAERGGPFSFVLGGDSVIKGWNVGIPGMKEGGTRLLVIPPGLAYGKSGRPGFVGADKTLLYRIKLLKVVAPH